MQSATRINLGANLLGQGSYASVYESVDPNTGESLAIKKAETKSLLHLQHKKRLLREIKLLRVFQGHPNIIPLRGLSISATSPVNLNHVNMVFKKFDTDLFKVIHSRQNITEEHVQYFIYQILCGVNFLHSAHVVHRDLKPSNIVINANCELAICDFGLARALKPLNSYHSKFNFSPSEASTVTYPASSASKQSGKPKFTRPLTPHVVTRWYRAPEIILLDGAYGLPVDMWSIGCILAELLKMQYNLRPKPLFPGKSAFPHSHEDNPMAFRDNDDQLNVIFDILGTPTKEDIKCLNNAKVKSYLASLPYKPPQSFSKMFPKANPAAIDLLNRLLQFDPAKRISAHDALRHEYLKPMVDDTMGLTFPLYSSPETISENEKSLLEYYDAEIDIDDQCEDKQSVTQHIRLHQLLMAEGQKYLKVDPLKPKQSNSIASSSAAVSSTAVISSALSATPPSVSSSAVATVKSNVETAELPIKPSEVASKTANTQGHNIPPNATVDSEQKDVLMTHAQSLRH